MKPLSILLLVLLSTATFASFINVNMTDVHYFGQLVNKGAMDGYFSVHQVERIINDFRLEYPDLFLPVEIIGRTFEKRPIKAHCITNKESESSTLKTESESKTMALLTALTHGREPLSLTTLMYLFHKMLIEYSKGTPEYVNLLNNNIVCYVPVVNIDSYEKTFRIYREKNKFFPIRRNRNDNIKCDKFGFYGVDLNRNFDYCWHIQNSGSSDDPCEYNYRGVAAFSEPETQALRNFVEEYQNSLKVAINIHCYGEIWILPFTCMHEKSPHDTPRVRAIYNDFKRYAPIEDKSTIGSTMQLLKYTTTGDSGDWFLGRYGIISMTPEVGKMDSAHGRQYFPRRQFILPAVHKAAPGIFYMVSRLNAYFENMGILFDQSGNKGNDTNMMLNLMYKSYRDLNNSELVIEFEVEDVQEPRYEQGLVPNITVLDKNMGDAQLNVIKSVEPADFQITYNPDTRSVKYSVTTIMNFRSWTMIRLMVDLPFLNYKSTLIDMKIKEKGNDVFVLTREFRGIHYTPANECAEAIIM